MTKYDFVLFDADNTLFDFDQAEHLALGETLEGYGIPFTLEHEALYLRINRALWDAFDRGEISQDRLVVERFAAFLQQAGYPGRADPEEMNRAYLAALARQGCLLPGAEELCAAPGPPLYPGHRHQRGLLGPAGAVRPLSHPPLCAPSLHLPGAGLPQAPAGVLPAGL